MLCCDVVVELCCLVVYLLLASLCSITRMWDSYCVRLGTS
jgi:hypothetical protein